MDATQQAVQQIQQLHADLQQLSGTQQALQQQLATQNQVLQAVQAAQGVIDQGPVVDELKKLVNNMTASQVLSAIPTFNGNPKEYKAWIKAIERQVSAIEGTDPLRVRLACQSASGVVGDYVNRLVTDRPGVDFNTLKKELAGRFSEIGDTATAMSALRKAKQKRDESPIDFSERILEIASDCYPGEDLGQPIIAAQLIDVYIDGLRDVTIARKILRENPPTYERAVALAGDEQKLQRRFELRKRVIEPMEIDSLQNETAIKQGSKASDKAKLKCERCEKKGHTASNCWTPVQKLPQNKQPPRRQQKPREEVSKYKDKRCYSCNQTGHFARSCPNSGNAQQGPAQQ